MARYDYSEQLATDAEIRPCAECAGPADLPRT